MPKLYSSHHIIKILLLHGFEFISQKGSYRKYRKKGSPTLTTIVPAEKKEVPFGTFNAILRQSKLQISDLENRS